MKYERLKKRTFSVGFAPAELAQKTPSRAETSATLAQDVDEFLRRGGTIEKFEHIPGPSHTYFRDLQWMDVVNNNKSNSLSSLRDRDGRLAIVDFYWNEGCAFIYFIQAGDKDGPIKIGFTRNPETRLTDLQVSNAQKLTIIGLFYGAISMESKLHRKFAKARIRGEWFRPVPRLLDTAELMYEMYRKGLNIPNFETFAKWLESRL